eukprot:8650018-Alexandrium_andersonii.AAC.1
MLLLNLVVVPWLRLLEDMPGGVRGRALADDLLVASGLDQDMGEQELVEVHQRALGATVAYLRG